MYIISLLFFMSKILQNSINNTYRSLLRGMWVWDKKFFKDFFPSLLQNKSTKLSNMTLDSGKERQEICKRNSHFLGKESFQDFPRKVEYRCFSLLWEITENTYICFDEVDLAKKRAKKMGGISKVWDGSEKNTVNGYMFHGASIDGIPLMLRREDLENRTKSDYFWEMILEMKKRTKWKGIYVLDAHYEAKSYIHFLDELWLNYIIRAKREKILYNIQWERIMKMKEFWEWVHEVYLRQDGKQKKRWEIVLTKTYLYVKQFPGYKDPMRIYSNSPDRDILEYKKRWDIECIFKTMKQEYQMEKIQASSLQVIENIVATIQMAVAIAHHLYGIQHKHKWKTFFQCHITLKNRFKKFIKWQSLTENRNAYIKFIAHIIKWMYKWKKKKRKQSITSIPELFPQQSLF